MKGPTKAPFGKAFAFAAVGLVLGVAALFAALGVPATAVDQGQIVGRVLGPTFFAAALTGFIARRAKTTWSLGRIGAVWLLVVAILTALQVAQHASVQPDPVAGRAELLAAMRKEFAIAAPDAPNLIDLLAERFPADIDGLIKEVGAARERTEQEFRRAHLLRIAKMLVTIQARDGANLAKTPIEAARTLMQAQRDVMAAVAENGTISCTTIGKAPTPEIARLSLIRTYDLLAAIADGRDHPAARAAVVKEDYVAFAKDAKSRGIDTSRWSDVSNATLAAQDPARVCAALISMYDAALSANSDLGERLRPDLESDLLTTDTAVYAPVLK
jgi:hypothetical protein